MLFGCTTDGQSASHECNKEAARDHNCFLTWEDNIMTSTDTPDTLLPPDSEVASQTHTPLAKLFVHCPVLNLVVFATMHNPFAMCTLTHIFHSWATQCTPFASHRAPMLMLFDLSIQGQLSTNRQSIQNQTRPHGPDTVRGWMVCELMLCMIEVFLERDHHQIRTASTAPFSTSQWETLREQHHFKINVIVKVALQTTNQQSSQERSPG